MKFKIIGACFISMLLSTQLSAQTNSVILKVGDKAPKLMAYQWLKGIPVTIFERGKTYLVDFGATWCVPCAKAIPHLSEIAKKYSGTKVIGVFVMEPKKNSSDYSYVQNVKKYVQKQADNIQYTVAVDDAKATIENDWIRAAGFNGIPQTFLVDKNGLIAWIGSANSEALDEEIKLINNSSYSIASAIENAEKDQSSKQATIEIDKPLFVADNGGNGNDFLFRSILTYYKGESSGDIGFIYSGKSAKISSEKQRRLGMVQQVGASIEKLYYLAYADTLTYSVYSRMIGTNEYPDFNKYPTTKDGYGNFWYKAILEVSDSSLFMVNYKSTANRYNYSLIVPDEVATAKYLQEIMRKDLATYFGYDVKVEERMMPYWKLIATQKAKQGLTTKTPGNQYRAHSLHDTGYQFNNAIIKDILIRFIFSFSYGQSIYGYVKPKEEAPFIDETGINGDIDYDITNSEFEEMNKGSWEAGLNFLHRIGLDLVKGERMTKVVVIRDSK